MKLLLPIIFLGVLLVSSCGKQATHSESNSKTPEQANVEQPELSPHFPTTNFVYVGEFFGNQTYIQLNDAGKTSSALADGHCVSSVVTARESVIVLFQNPKTGDFAVLDPADPESSTKKASELKFAPASSESRPSKAWARATTPSAYEADRQKGRLQEWVFVDIAESDREIDRFYVGTEIKTEPKSGFRYVPILNVTEERFMFFLDPKNKKFAPVRTDFLWTPLEEMKYREITAGGLGEAVLNFVTAKVK